MHIHIDQLHAHLKKNMLAPVYLVSGDELLQRQQAEDAIRAAARAAHDTLERVVLYITPGFDWGVVQRTTMNRSLFSEKQLIELRFTGKVDSAAEKTFISYTEKGPTDHILMISMNKIEKKTQQTKWFKALAKIGVIIQVWPIDSARLPKWIATNVAKKGRRIDTDAAHLLATRVEGNLIAAQQEIDKLCLLSTGENISIEQCISMVTAHPHYNLFSLLEHSFAGQVQRTIKMLSGLRNEGIEPIALYGAVMWALRQLCMISYQYDSDSLTANKPMHAWIRGINKTAINALLKRHGSTKIQQIFYKAVQLEQQIKGANKADAWDQLALLLLQLAGIRFTTSTDNNIN